MKRPMACLLAGLLFCAPIAARAGSQTGVQNTIDTSSADNQAFTGVTAMTVGTVYAPGRSLYINATGPGNVKVAFFDGSTLVIPVNVGITILPFAVTEIVSSGTTATATYAQLLWVPGG